MHTINNLVSYLVIVVTFEFDNILKEENWVYSQSSAGRGHVFHQIPKIDFLVILLKQQMVKFQSNILSFYMLSQAMECLSTVAIQVC